MTSDVRSHTSPRAALEVAGGVPGAEIGRVGNASGLEAVRSPSHGRDRREARGTRGLRYQA